MYNAIENLCKKFAPYVTGNYRNNHLNIYISKDGTTIRNGIPCSTGKPNLSCYGLGKVNWSGPVEEYEPFYEEFRKIFEMMPENCYEIHVEYFCGHINKINKEFDE